MRALSRNDSSDHRTPGRRNEPVTIAILLDKAIGWERIMEALNPHLVGHQHVIDLAPGGLRHRGILVEHQVPAWMSNEQCWVVGHVGLDKHLVRAGRQHERGVPGRVADRSYRE